MYFIILKEILDNLIFPLIIAIISIFLEHYLLIDIKKTKNFLTN